MTISRGFYRHYKGHLYFVHGVGCAKHEGDRRLVVYTSVKTEQSGEGFDFLLRDEETFEQWVHPSGQTSPALLNDEEVTACRNIGWRPRFERITDPELSIVPRP